MTFVELIGAIHDALHDAKIPHAFGGALAYGIVASPRGTIDIDVNVFVSPAELGDVSAALAKVGYAQTDPDEGIAGGARYLHTSAAYPIDVFPALDDEYAEMAQRVVRHPFGKSGRKLPFLSPEDLCVFKLSFGRPKDWVDLASLRAVTALDDDYIARKLLALRGPTMHPRLARFRALSR